MSDVRTNYQVMPPLSEQEYDLLREDIKVHGVLQAIEVDEEGVILDGHHRKAIAAELGIRCPERIVKGLRNATSKRTYAYTVNSNRRQIGTEQRRAMVEKSLREDPQLTDREHSRRTGVSPTTVGTARARLVASGQVSSLDTRVDPRGYQQPAARPKTAAGLDIVPADGEGVDLSATPAAGAGLDTSPAPAVTPNDLSAGHEPVESETTVTAAASAATGDAAAWPRGDEVARDDVRPDVVPGTAPAESPYRRALREAVEQYGRDSAEANDAELRMHLNGRLQAFYGGLANLDTERVALVAGDDLLDRLGEAQERFNQFVNDVYYARRHNGRNRLRAV